MKRKKNLKGFTLIELIVVIAIIGVLAAILVPAMMGWVRKSQITTLNNNASEVCTQLQTVLVDLDSSNVGFVDDVCVVSFDGTNFTSTTSLNPDMISAMRNINSTLQDMSKAKWSAEISKSTVSAVIFTNDNYKHVGGFPVQCNYEYSTDGKDTSVFLNCAKTSWN